MNLWDYHWFWRLVVLYYYYLGRLGGFYLRSINEQGMIEKYWRYKIQRWCGLSPPEHIGAGGCWGISYGLVEKEGENYCSKGPCEYYKR